MAFRADGEVARQYKELQEEDEAFLAGAQMVSHVPSEPKTVSTPSKSLERESHPTGEIMQDVPIQAAKEVDITTTTTANTTIIGAKPVMGQTIFAKRTSTHNARVTNVPDAPGSLESLSERLFFVTEVNWNTSDAKDAVLVSKTFPRELMVAGYGPSDGFKRFGAFRADLFLQAEVIASKYDAGIIALVVYPSALPGSSRNWQSRDHAILSCDKPIARLQTVFRSHRRVISIMPGVEIEQIWDVHLRVVSPLTAVAGNGSCKLILRAMFVNLEMFMPVPAKSLTMYSTDMSVSTKNVRMLKAIAELLDSGDDYTPADLLGVIGRVAKNAAILDGVENFIATATDIASKAMPILETITAFADAPNVVAGNGMCAVDAPFRVLPLTDSRNVAQNDTSNVNLGYTEVTDLRDIARIYSEVDTFSWSINDSTATPKKVWAVGPLGFDPIVDDTTPGWVAGKKSTAPSNVAVVANCFTRWRGSMGVRFTVAATESHTGTLYVVYIPGKPPADALSQAMFTDALHWQINLKGGSQTYEVFIPYMCPHDWLSVGNYAKRDKVWVTCTGVLVVYADNLHSNSVAAPTINVNVEVAAGPDMMYETLRDGMALQGALPINFMTNEPYADLPNFTQQGKRLKGFDPSTLNASRKMRVVSVAPNESITGAEVCLPKGWVDIGHQAPECEALPLYSGRIPPQILTRKPALVGGATFTAASGTNEGWKFWMRLPANIGLARDVHGISSDPDTSAIAAFNCFEYYRGSTLLGFRTMSDSRPGHRVAVVYNECLDDISAPSTTAPAGVSVNVLFAKTVQGGSHYIPSNASEVTWVAVPHNNRYQATPNGRFTGLNRDPVNTGQFLVYVYLDASQNNCKFVTEVWVRGGDDVRVYGWNNQAVLSDAIPGSVTSAVAHQVPLPIELSREITRFCKRSDISRLEPQKKMSHFWQTKLHAIAKKLLPFHLKGEDAQKRVQHFAVKYPILSEAVVHLGRSRRDCELLSREFHENGVTEIINVSPDQFVRHATEETDDFVDSVHEQFSKIQLMHDVELNPGPAMSTLRPQGKEEGLITRTISAAIKSASRSSIEDLKNFIVTDPRFVSISDKFSSLLDIGNATLITLQGLLGAGLVLIIFTLWKQLTMEMKISLVLGCVAVALGYPKVGLAMISAGIIGSLIGRAIANFVTERKSIPQQDGADDFIKLGGSIITLISALGIGIGHVAPDHSVCSKLGKNMDTIFSATRTVAGMTLMFNSLANVCRMCMCMYKYGTWEEPKYGEWYYNNSAEIDAKVAATNRLYLSWSVGHYIEDSAYASEVNEVYTWYRDVLTPVLTDPLLCNLAPFRRMQEVWTKIGHGIEARCKFAASRAEPVVIFLYGPAGCGKSTAASNIAYQIQGALGLTNSIYGRCDNAHWDSYHGEKIIIMDDFGQYNDDQRAKDFFQAVSNTTWIPAQAALEEKGRPAEPLVFIVTCNAAFPQFQGVTTPSALYRRFHYHIRVSARGKYMRNNTLNRDEVEKLSPLCRARLSYLLLKRNAPADVINGKETTPPPNTPDEETTLPELLQSILETIARRAAANSTVLGAPLLYSADMKLGQTVKLNVDHQAIADLRKEDAEYLGIVNPSVNADLDLAEELKLSGPKYTWCAKPGQSPECLLKYPAIPAVRVSELLALNLKYDTSLTQAEFSTALTQLRASTIGQISRGRPRQQMLKMIVNYFKGVDKVVTVPNSAYPAMDYDHRGMVYKLRIQVDDKDATPSRIAECGEVVERLHQNIPLTDLSNEFTALLEVPEQCVLILTRDVTVDALYSSLATTQKRIVAAPLNKYAALTREQRVLFLQLAFGAGLTWELAPGSVDPIAPANWQTKTVSEAGYYREEDFNNLNFADGYGVILDMIIAGDSRVRKVTLSGKWKEFIFYSTRDPTVYNWWVFTGGLAFAIGCAIATITTLCLIHGVREKVEVVAPPPLEDGDTSVLPAVGNLSRKKVVDIAGIKLEAVTIASGMEMSHARKKKAGKKAGLRAEGVDEDVTNVLRKHLYVVKIIRPDNSTSLMHGLLVRTGRLLVPAHLFGVIEEIAAQDGNTQLGTLNIVRSPRVGSLITVDVPVMRNSVVFYRNEDDSYRDIAMINVGLRLGTVNLEPYFALDSYAGSMDKVGGYNFAYDMNTRLFADGPHISGVAGISSSGHTEIGWASQDCLVYKGYFRDGMCGSPIVSCAGSGRGQVVGYHIGSWQKCFVGVGVKMSREDVQELLLLADDKWGFNPVPPTARPDVVALDGDEDTYEHSNLECVGSVSANLIGHEKRNADYFPTPWSGEVMPVTKLPSVTHTKDEVDPYILAVAKLGGADGSFGAEELYRAYMHVTRSYVHWLKETGAPTLRRLTLDEAINGCPEFGLKPLDMSTSPGLPYTRHGFSHKSNLFENIAGKWVPTAAFRKQIISVLDRIAKGSISPWLFASSLKAEMLPSEKVQSGKARLFDVPPIDCVIVTRMYFGAITGWFNTHWSSSIGSAVGIDRDSEWSILATSLQHHPCHFDVDYSSYDASIPSQMAEVFVGTICSLYPSEDHVGIKTIAVGLTEVYRVIRDKVYRTTHGNPSGSALTTFFNTYVNYFNHVAAWYSLLPAKSDLDFDDHVVVFTYGDDAIASVSNEASYFYNPTGIARVLNAAGFRVTSAAKVGTMAWRDFDELQFLKSKFVPCSGKYLAPIDETVIANLYNYCTAPTCERYVDNFKNILSFAFHHGRQYYETQVVNIKQLYAKHVITQEFTPPTYDEAFARWLSLN
ncbi:hypothetical protein [Wenzhou picorna-like virus 49]|uniref:hypothetical protein n=1 Tax=Wenzhou picorna-like virus 49 TaxID=1923636 RepID=UPI00090AA0EE|nr:hypothetical protein [Wenzhou picorna-like virus 49]APG78506.1 hypothetical protein [Wenzhou picorna-like virus 49]